MIVLKAELCPPPHPFLALLPRQTPESVSFLPVSCSTSAPLCFFPPTIYFHSCTIPSGFPNPRPRVTPRHQAALGEAVSGSSSGRPQELGAWRPDRGRRPCAPGEAEVAPDRGKQGHPCRAAEDQRAVTLSRPWKAGPGPANPSRSRESRVPRNHRRGARRGQPGTWELRDASPPLRAGGVALPATPRGEKGKKRGLRSLPNRFSGRPRGSGSVWATGWERSRAFRWRISCGGSSALNASFTGPQPHSKS